MRVLFFLCLVLALAGCMVGPDYTPPPTPLPAAFSEERPEKTYPIADGELARWWNILGDPFLSELMEETLNSNFDFYIALENAVQARAQFRIQVAQLLPEIDFYGFAERYRRSLTLGNAGSLGPPIQNLYQVGFDATWEIDVFGGQRRAARAAFDTIMAQEENARDVQITVLSEVASTYTSIRSLQIRENLALQRVNFDEETFDLSFARFQAGLANEQQVETARANLEADKATLGMFEILLKQKIYSLGTLLGRDPETIVGQFQELAPIPKAADRVPVGLPSDLLRRRPDIRSAERQLASATEQIGVAVAALYPQFSLVGGNSSPGNYYGYQSSAIGNLFKQASRIWNIGPQVTLPIFDFGRRLASVAQQYSIERQALLTYQKTVVQALEDVESALIAYFTETERNRNFTLEVAANRRNAALMRDEFQAGLVNYDEVLSAEVTLLTSEDNLTLSDEALTSNFIAVYKAIGGEWACIYMP